VYRGATAKQITQPGIYAYVPALCSVPGEARQVYMRIYTCGVEEMPTTKVEAGAGGRLPSIEMEPRTLTVDQIKYARVSKLTTTVISNLTHTLSLPSTHLFFELCG
jgi:hypothetical protein